jgi:uncharacterized protein
MSSSTPPAAGSIMQKNVAFPYAITALGLTDGAAYTEHVQQLIRQLLLTSPGERVNQPLFGCELRRMVFDVRRNELATATETLVHGALERWLGDVIHVQSLAISLAEDSVTVDLRYIENRTQKSWFVRFIS